MKAALLVTAVLFSLTAVVGVTKAPAAGTATRTVGVTLKEWKLVPAVSRASAGKVTFLIRNTGKISHEFVVLRTARHHHQLPMSGGMAKETGRLGEVEVAPGQRKRLTVTLKAGKYVLICNLPGHYKAGQYASFTVG